MPDLPLVERIAQNLLDTVKGISTAAGYHNNVARVVRRQQFGSASADRLIVLSFGDRGRNDEANPLNGFVTWDQVFAFHCVCVEIEEGDPIDRRITTIAADVEKAVMVDPKRGELAHDTFLNGAEIFPDDEGGGVAGVSVVITVRYCTRLTDPNIQA